MVPIYFVILHIILVHDDLKFSDLVVVLTNPKNFSSICSVKYF